MSWITDLIGTFVDVALADPISFLLVLTGQLLLGGASAVMGYLALGALADALTPDLTPGRE